MASLLDKWRTLEAIVADARLSDAAKLVAFRLLSHLNTSTGRCNPSYATLAAGVGKGRRRIIDATAELEAAGWISVERTSGGDPSAKAGFATNSFVLKLSTPSAENDTPPGVENCTPPGARNNTPPSVADGTPPGVESGTTPVSETALPPVSKTTPKYRKENTGKEVGNLKPGKSKSDGPEAAAGSQQIDGDAPDGFDTWWSAYPRHEGKGAARRAYTSALRKATVGELLEGARRYSGATADREQRFIKMPATWLNAESWTDELPLPNHRKGPPVIDEWRNPVSMPAPRPERADPGDAIDRAFRVGRYRDAQ